MTILLKVLYIISCSKEGLIWLSKDFSILKSILRSTELQADFH